MRKLMITIVLIQSMTMAFMVREHKETKARLHALEVQAEMDDVDIKNLIDGDDFVDSEIEALQARIK